MNGTLRTAPLPATRVFIVPLLSCNDVDPPTAARLEELGKSVVASAVSDARGVFELTVPPGDFTFFADVSGWLRPTSSRDQRCNRLRVVDQDIAMSAGETNVRLPGAP